MLANENNHSKERLGRVIEMLKKAGTQDTHS
jgi:hypothetical protein